MLTWRPPNTTDPFELARPASDTLLGRDPGALLADRFAQFGFMICRITTGPVADANATRPFLRAPATSTCAMLTTGSFFFLGGPLPRWFFGLVS